MSTVDQTLEERGQRYGRFIDVATTTQLIKAVMAESENWEGMSMGKREALDMIASKIGRILNGDSSHADSWHDISGYARLVEQDLNESLTQSGCEYDERGHRIY